MKQVDIPVSLDLGALAAVCFRRYETVLLDDSRRGLSVFGVDPRARYSWHQGQGEILRGERRERADEPFEALRRLLADLPRPSASLRDDHLPFVGGLLGHIGYDAGRAIERVPDANPSGSTLPDIHFGLHDLVLVRDEGRGVIRVIAADPASADARVRQAEELIEAAAAEDAPTPFRPEGRVPAVSAIPRDDYLAAVERIRESIRNGDVYQVNLTQRLLARCDADPLALFLAVRQRHPAAYGALYRVGEAWVLSSSPECFLRVEEREVLTRPIKGTAPRASDPTEDRARAEALAASQKDRAELAMIVDLMRNDLNRVCAPGSVRVPEHAALQEVPTVHHLVSRVTGTLDEGRDVFDLLRATHPGGSITGAPKIAAMHAIDRLEPLRRGVYTGGIGYLGVDGRAELNIAIRTMVLEAGWAHVHGGGGIVIDSDPEGEYDESLAKVRGLLEILGAEVRL